MSEAAGMRPNHNVPDDVRQSEGIKMQTSLEENKKKQKMQCCVYCEKLIIKVPRHMEKKHENEIEVAKILVMPKRSKERKNAWMTLVSKGNYSHNCNVLREGKGTVIPKYRPRSEDMVLYTKDEYLPCQFCLAFIRRSDLWKHQRSCPCQESSKQPIGQAAVNGRLLVPCSFQASEGLKQIIFKMIDDKITTLVKADELIIKFGERCFEKLGHHQHQQNYISQRMRELGRLLLSMKAVDPTRRSLEQCLFPENWELLLKAIKDVAGYDDATKSYKIPSLPLKLGHSLSKCARIIRNRAVITEDTTLRTKAEGFLHLYQDEWSDRISAQALESASNVRFDKPLLVPTVDDIKKFHCYIEKRMEQLLDKDDQLLFTEMIELSLVSIILFNRKRSGEAERIKVKDFERIKTSPQVDTAITESLSKFEIALLQTHDRIVIRGKKGSKVPVIFTERMKQNVEKILEFRIKLKIDSEYLFAKPGARFPVRGTDVMRKHANLCGASNPSLLMSTNLRKQLGTISQILNLTDTNLDLLAKFMGHDIRIHREYYRLPQSTLEIAKVAKILHAINEGKLSKIAGKDFDQIEVDEAGKHMLVSVCSSFNGIFMLILCHNTLLIAKVKILLQLVNMSCSRQHVLVLAILMLPDTLVGGDMNQRYMEFNNDLTCSLEFNMLFCLNFPPLEHKMVLIIILTFD